MRITRLYFKIILKLFVVGLVLTLFCGGVFADNQELKKLSSKKLKQLELIADEGRKYFHIGNYESAAATFEKLTIELTVSTPLYLNELGSCYLAMGDHKAAKETFFKSAQLLEAFYDEGVEKSAVSYFGSESKKIYKGDPYERSMLLMLLGLLFLQDNDLDNSLACFKNGILADTDVENELYKSDFTLLHSLEAKVIRARGQSDAVDGSILMAGQAYKQTHPTVQTLIHDQQILLDKTTSKPKENHSAELKDMSERVETSMEGISLNEIEPLLNLQYNTLLVIWSGQAPSKQRVGEYGEKDVLVLNPSTINRYEMIFDQDFIDAIQGVANVNFQATTRGGRQMDNVLKSQAEFKTFTKDFGDSLIDHSGDVGGYAGLGMLAIGLISKGISTATTPEADIRHWANLPASLQIIPLSLPEGEYTSTILGFHDYIKVSEQTITFDVYNQNPVNVVFIFPPKQS